jgi:hypothetical protein
MENKEIIICSVKKQRDMLGDLIEELEPKSKLEEYDIQYCEEVLKRVQGIIKDLKKAKYDHGKYGERPIYRIFTALHT